MGLAIYEKEPNITWVNYKFIEQRIDAQYYKREFVENEIKLKQIKNLPLKELYTRGDYGTLPDSADYSEKGIYLIRGTDLRDLSIKEDDLILVPEEYFSDKSEVKSEDILILIKGATIDAEWSVSIVPKINYKAIFNGSIFRIRLKKEYDPYFVTAFMSTKYFLYQKKRAISNTGIYYNDKESIENFIISIPSPEIQKYIGDKVRKAEELREEAKRLKKEAEEIINKAFSFKELDLIYKENKAKFQWINTDILIDRIDGNYYEEKYIETINHMKRKSKNYVTLNSLIDSIYTGKKPIYDEKGAEVYFVQSGNISSNFLEIDNKEKVDLSKYSQVLFGDLLIAKDGETIGKIAINLTNETIIINEHTYCIRLKEKYKYYSAYIYYLLINDYINPLIRREATGSAQKGLNFSFAENIIIPILEEDIIMNLYNLELRRCNNIYKSKQLIQEAKQDVEDLIEGNFDMSKVKANN